MSTDQFRDLAIVANAAGPVEAADDLLAARCDWITCPTCGGGMVVAGCFDPCPDCDGTGHPTVAQVLAWGEAVASMQHAEPLPGHNLDTIDGWNDCLDALRSVKP